MNWDEYFMRHVYLAASKSKDPKTKIGAVLVRDKHLISEGFNGIPMGVNDSILERTERPAKYSWFEHAERNSVYCCARYGISSLGTTMFTNGIPCCDCARATIQGGVKEIVVHKQWQEFEKEFYWEKWIESAKISKIMFDECGISVRIFDGKLDLIGNLDGKKIIV